MLLVSLSLNHSFIGLRGLRRLLIFSFIHSLALFLGVLGSLLKILDALSLIHPPALSTAPPIAPPTTPEPNTAPIAAPVTPLPPDVPAGT